MFLFKLKSPPISSKRIVSDKNISLEDETEYRKANPFSNNDSCHIIKEDEICNSMQSHFVRNHLQQITLLLEMLQYENDDEKRTLVNKALNICNQTADTLIKIEKIHTLLKKKSFETTKEKIILVETLNKVSKLLNLPIKIDHKSLDYTLLVDEYFSDCIFEIISFLSSIYGNKIFIYGKKVLENPSYLVLSICEDSSNPLDFDICEQILQDIEEKNWVSTKKYLGLTLSCLIAKKYNGKLTIIPHSGRGNTFNLSLPTSLIL